MAADEKNKAIDLAISQIERQHGKGAIMRFSSEDILPVEVIPTGSLALDIALGVGGVPRGRIVEIFGHESSGKTTLALHIVAEAQKMGGNAAFVDVEHAIDPLYAKNIGVNMEHLLISQPDTGEQALEIVETLVRSNAIDVIVVDSVAALTPQAEIEGEMGDAHVGLLPRLMSKALRKLSGVTSKSKACIIFTNQIRQKIGVMFGNPETTPGGLALKFHASVRLEIRRAETLKEGDEMVGNRIRVKVAKNKVAPPFTQAEFEMTFGEGISKLGDLLDVATDQEIVSKSGAWFSYNNERLGQGRNSAKEYLIQHPEVIDEIETKVRENLGIYAQSAPASIAGVDPDTSKKK
ncbi:recombinase RecA [Candidatus Poribacteria bacterium]|nr:recombinase RecA [Candidatus Poribacteria bacterium]